MFHGSCLVFRSRVARGVGKRAKGECRLQELNRNPVEGSSCLEECVEAGRGFGWGAGRQAQVAQNLGNHRGIVNNGGEDGQGAATLGTGGDIDGEDACE